MKLGLFGARGDRKGLASMTTDFARHMQPDKILGIDVGAAHSPYPNDWGGFNDLGIVKVEDLSERFLKEWFADLDAVWFAETGYDEKVFPIAREYARTFLHAMPEFYPWDQPTDVVANPTTWRLTGMPGAIHFPFPVDTKRFRFRQRTEAQRFIHVVGHPATLDRNGTLLVAQALRFLRSPVEIVIRTRRPVDLGSWRPGRAKLTVEVRDLSDSLDLYEDGDVLLLPRRYGGQSLPMNEASALGLPVVALDVAPQNEFLPSEGLVPARKWKRLATPGGILDVYTCRPQDLAAKMDELHASPALVRDLSVEAGMHAASISWGVLAEPFRDLLAGTPPRVRAGERVDFRGVRST